MIDFIYTEKGDHEVWLEDIYYAVISKESDGYFGLKVLEPDCWICQEVLTEILEMVSMLNVNVGTIN